MNVQQAITLIDNTLAQVQTTRQNHAVLQQALQIVVIELNKLEVAHRQVCDTGTNTNNNVTKFPAEKLEPKKE